MAPVAPKRLMVWDDLLSRPKPVADMTVRYGADALQVVDVWKPVGAGPHPAVVMIHGGCWQTEIAERDIMNWIADDLRKHGVGVWNIEYRGVDRGGGYPGTYQDVGAAADMFAAKRAEFGFKTDAPVVTIGHSAGGHLATMLLTCQWPQWAPDLPADLVKNALSISGLFELESISHTPFLKDALQLIDVRVLDHIIVAPGQSCSLAERGVL